MTTTANSAQFAVTRTIVVHVSGSLDSAATEQLRRILHDLVENQGLNSLIVDLSNVDDVTPEVPSALEAARTRMLERGGTLILQIALDPPPPLLHLATALPTFAPVRTGKTRLG